MTDPVSERASRAGQHLAGAGAEQATDERLREQAPTWWRKAVVYQVYPRSFADSDDDGIGDIRGVISKLDYLHRLGVDVLWLSPFFRSPQDDNGYDISDYQDVDPMFGTLADVDELIAGLHARDMKFVMDVVINHTSDEHPWFVESRSSTDNPKRDWYWWRPVREGMTPGTPGAEPTNWRAFFAPSAWEWDETTGEYYLHLFTRKQPDLNWENRAVRQELYRMLRWWLDRGVDGFRMDVINIISKVLPLKDGPQVFGGPYGDGYAEFIGGPRIHEFLRDMNREVIAERDKVLITVGEMPGVTIEEARRFTDPANAEVDMVFQFEHVNLDHGPNGKFDVRPLRLTDLKASFGKWQTALAEVGWNSLYWDNHDQPRVVSRFGSDDPRWRTRSAKALATVLHLHRGTPYVYQGEELGMTNFPFASMREVQDVESLHAARIGEGLGMSSEAILSAIRARGRDNARTPMQWDDTPHAGFTLGTPWLPVNPNYKQINAAAQVNDPDSVFAHYQALVRLRHDLPVIAEGDFEMLLPDHETVYAFTRSLDGETLLVLANFSAAQQSVDLAEPDAELVMSNYGDRASPVGTLHPWEATIYRTAGAPS